MKVCDPVLGGMITILLSFQDFKVDYEIPWQKIEGSEGPWHHKGVSNEKCCRIWPGPGKAEILFLRKREKSCVPVSPALLMTASDVLPRAPLSEEDSGSEVPVNLPVMKAGLPY